MERVVLVRTWYLMIYILKCFPLLLVIHHDIIFLFCTCRIKNITEDDESWSPINWLKWKGNTNTIIMQVRVCCRSFKTYQRLGPFTQLFFGLWNLEIPTKYYQVPGAASTCICHILNIMHCKIFHLVQIHLWISIK